MIKALRKLGIEGMYLNIIKALYDKPIFDIILDGGKLKPFPLKLGTRQGCPLSLCLLNSPGIPSQSSKLRRRNKEIQIGKETVKLSLFADDMILYLKDPRKFHSKTRHDKQLQQCNRIQTQLTKSVAFLFTNNEQIEKEY
jgi:hypothetical protein